MTTLFTTPTAAAALVPAPPFLADAYIHALDPVIVDLPGPLAVRWYGVAYLLGFIAAWLLLKWLAATKRIAIAPRDVGDFILSIIVGVLVGGRLGYVIFYDQSLLWPPTGILQVWRGGMASHGGLLGVGIACAIFAKRRRTPTLHVVDYAALATPPGLLFGRIANFINAELWGKRLPADMQGADSPWWSVKYPQELLAHQGTDLARMTAIPEAAEGIDPDAWVRIASAYDHVRGSHATQVMTDWVDRIIVQIRGGNEALADALRPVLTAYYPSQLIQAFAEGIVLCLVLTIIWLRPRKSGVVASWFLIVYGVLRIWTELYRQPDEGVAIILGLQRGQLLSALMSAAGGVMLTIVLRRKTPKLGGLLQPSEATVTANEARREATVTAETRARQSD